MGERDSQRLRAVVARRVAASTTSHAAEGVGCSCEGREEAKGV